MSEEMQIELKPCPFCGGEARVNHRMDIGVPFGDSGHIVSVRCDCGAKIECRAAKEEWARNYAVKAWNRCLQKAAPMAEWISVEERLPEQYGPFLIADNEGNMEVATWTKQFGWFSGCYRVKHVTHWMPLPEPPKED